MGCPLFSFVFLFFVLLADDARQFSEAVVSGGGRAALGYRLVSIQRDICVAASPLLRILRDTHLHMLLVPMDGPIDRRGTHAPRITQARRRDLVLVDVEPGEVAEVVLANDGLDFCAHLGEAAPLPGIREVGVGDRVQQAELLHGDLSLSGEEGEVLCPLCRLSAHGDNKVLCAGRIPEGVAEHFVRLKG